LNELPIELIEDLTPGPSWLSYAKSSGVQTSRAAAATLRNDDYVPPKKKNLYTGQTYNSADAIAEFFRNRGARKEEGDKVGQGDGERKANLPLSALERLKAAGTPKTKDHAPMSDAGFTPGSHVTHEKYGRGLVLRREGSGDNVKLTVSFPGYGQKKLIEKYANLQKA